MHLADRAACSLWSDTSRQIMTWPRLGFHKARSFLPKSANETISFPY
ncbi:conserved hypothetical protein [Roseibium sp. TrichSKD4]|nr:conserved hypothetical protein [Roseibium sp. TrichSKD4]